MSIFKSKELAKATERIDQLSTAFRDQQLETRRLTDRLEESASSGLYDWRLQRDRGWQLISGRAMQKLTKPDIDNYFEVAEFYYIFNPLIKRVVDIRTLFTFSKKFEISVSKEDETKKQNILDPILDDPYNLSAFVSQQAIEHNDKMLQKGGNLFIAIYKYAKPQPSIRIMPMKEITEIITDPNDCYKPLFYKRQHNGKTTYYPDFRNTDKSTDGIVDNIIDWTVAIYHVSVNKIDTLGFGITDLAAAYRWAEAGTQFLEDWGAVMRTIRKYSTMVSTPSTNQSTINAIGASFAGDTNSMNTPLQSNPSGSMLTMGGGNEYKVVDAGSSKVMGPADVRQFYIMVCTASGVPETLLTGDPSTGNLATAKELSGPFMTLIESRQEMWADVWRTLCNYLLTIQGYKDIQIKVSFPPLMQENINDRINAIVSAATLDSKVWAGTMSMRDVVREIYQTLDIEISDDELKDIALGVESNQAATEALKRINENVKMLISKN